MVDYLKNTKEDLFNLKSEIISNAKKPLSKEKLLPRYSTKQDFFETRASYLENHIRNFNTNENLNINYQNFQEYRLNKLFYYLQESNRKFKFHSSSKENLSGNFTSQFCIVYDIIKGSRELISCIYLLNWLESIYLKDNPKRDVEKKFFFSNKLVYENEKDFNPDCFNDLTLLSKFNCIPSQNDMGEYFRILDRIVIKVRSGNLVEAQNYAEYNNLFNISAILFGGLPVNDFLFDDLIKIAKIDFDLFPNYMRNKDFEKLKMKSDIIRETNTNNNNIDNFSNENFSDEKNNGGFNENDFVGNPNWLSWFYSNYQLSNIEDNDNSTKNLSKMLQSFLSGNSKYFENIENFNPYDWLYTKIMNIFNSKLIKEYLATQKLDLHFTDDPDFSQYLNDNSELKIEKIITELQKMEYYKNDLLSNDYLIDIELEIIKAHFSNSTMDKLDFLEYIFKKLSFYISDDNLSQYLKNQFFIFFNKNYFNSIPEEHKEIIFNNYMDNCILNYWKFAFESQLGIFLVFDDIINPELLNKKDIYSSKIKNIIILSEEIIKGFFNRVIEIIIDENIPELSVYLLSFWTDVTKIIDSLIYLASKISNKNQFDKLIKEIDIHFEPFTEIINNSLANQSKIYPLVFFIIICFSILII